MRVDDWNEDSGEEPREEWAPAPEPRPAAPRPAMEATAGVVAPATDAAPARPYTRPPLRVMWPIYLIGGVSVGMICVMFLIVMALIATR